MCSKALLLHPHSCRKPRRAQPADSRSCFRLLRSEHRARVLRELRVHIRPRHARERYVGAPNVQTWTRGAHYVRRRWSAAHVKRRTTTSGVREYDSLTQSATPSPRRSTSTAHRAQTSSTPYSAWDIAVRLVSRVHTTAPPALLGEPPSSAAEFAFEHAASTAPLVPAVSGLRVVLDILTDTYYMALHAGGTCGDKGKGPAPQQCFRQLHCMGSRQYEGVPRRSGADAKSGFCLPHTSDLVWGYKRVLMVEAGGSRGGHRNVSFAIGVTLPVWAAGTGSACDNCLTVPTSTVPSSKPLRTSSVACKDACRLRRGAN